MDLVTSYTYNPIRPNELRLLRFLPDQDQTSAVLETCSVEELPPYCSLSYTWASPETGMRKSWAIQIDTGYLPVLDTLQSFVQVLRAKNTLCEHRWWIDSICIDQANLEERAQQVRLMQQIYDQAARMIVWLGEESKDSNLAFDFIKLHDKVFREGWSVERIRTTLQTDEYSAHWIALTNFLSRKWWTRVWTIQEFVISRSVTFWCSKQKVSRHAVCHSLSITDKCTSTGVKETLAFRCGFNRRRAWDLYSVSANRTILALTAYFCFMDATDDRDRLYGLMALSTDASLLLHVNYTINCEEVYLRFAQAFITWHNSLDIICFATVHSPPPNSSLPSWVPDWHRKEAFEASHVTPLMVCQAHSNQIGNLRSPRLIGDGPYVYYSASKDRPAMYEVKESKLLVRGIIVDIVDGIAGSRDAAFVQSSGDAFQSPSSSVLSPSSIDILKSVCKALVLDRKDRFLQYAMPASEFFYDFIRLCAPLTDVESNTSTLIELKKWFQWTKSLRIGGRTFANILGDSDQAGVDFSGPAPNNDEYIQDSFIGRFFDTVVRLSLRLMVSCSGRIGMVQEKAMKGDLVCVLFGCSVPILLRQSQDEDSFTLVGECFLDGCMDGLIVEQYKLLEREFCIK